jgi:hypothetical protein
MTSVQPVSATEPIPLMKPTPPCSGAAVRRTSRRESPEWAMTHVGAVQPALQEAASHRPGLVVELAVGQGYAAVGAGQPRRCAMSVIGKQMIEAAVIPVSGPVIAIGLLVTEAHLAQRRPAGDQVCEPVHAVTPVPRCLSVASAKIT